MSDALVVECGLADEFGRRTVSATCGRLEHRDRFNTDDSFRRRRFAEETLNKFGWAVTADVLADIDSLVVREATARDATNSRGGVYLRVTRISEVPPGEVQWLWPGRVPLGAITLLSGDPGLGKSFMTLDIAARVSRGGSWPDETTWTGLSETGNRVSERRDHVPPASVLLFSAEDDLKTTIRPRLQALGADCDRVVTAEATDGGDLDTSLTRPLDLSRDLDQLTAAIEQLGDCRLVVVDPVSAYLGRTSENNNAEVRALLAPLAGLANKHQLAVVLVSHLRKEEGAAMYRSIGSVAFVAAARAAWIVSRDPHRSSRRLLLPVKNNLAPEVGGLAFAIEPVDPAGAAVVCWEADRVEMSIESAVNSGWEPVNRPDPERQLVVEWLRNFLAAGPQPTRVVRQTAEAHGFSYSTLRRAFRLLGGQAVKTGGEVNGAWLWKLPTERSIEDVQDAHREGHSSLSTLTPPLGRELGAERQDAHAPAPLEMSTLSAFD